VVEVKGGDCERVADGEEDAMGMSVYHSVRHLVARWK
jgi:hypothetical protein